jgi:antitoxin MazE
MRWTIGKWGNSLALRIPQSVAEQLGVREGSQVEVTASDEVLVVRKPRHTLDSLVKGITPENRHDEVDFGRPEGMEEW